MAQGKVRSALRYLSQDENNGVLSLDDTIPSTDGLTTRDLLKDKHPSTGSPARPESLMSDSPEPVVDPILYCNLDSACILNPALHTHGAAGLSGLDTYALKISALLLLVGFALAIYIQIILQPLLPAA